MRRQWFTVGTVVLVLAVFVAGGGWFAARVFIGSPDAVRVVVSRIQPPLTPLGAAPAAGPVTITPIFDRRFTSQATAVYQQLISSGVIPANAAQSCPAISSTQPYYHYALTFYHLGVQVATATSDGIGCEDIDVVYPGGGRQVYFWLGQGHSSFWVRLHQLTNAPEPIGICMTMPLCHS